MVCASETEEGRAWSEVRIKQLTGGDRIAARFMRQDFFEFSPQFKLTIIGNHVPELHNVDAAARRRFNLAPFTHKPPVIDKELEGKLRAEWPDILRWIWSIHLCLAQSSPRCGARTRSGRPCLCAVQQLACSPGARSRCHASRRGTKLHQPRHLTSVLS
jgi:hypothetical protein